MFTTLGDSMAVDSETPIFIVRRQYDRLWRHWRQVLPVPVLALPYESNWWKIQRRKFTEYSITAAFPGTTTVSNLIVLGAGFSPQWRCVDPSTAKHLITGDTMNIIWNR